MGNTKHRKNHAQKLRARQERLKQEQNRINNYRTKIMETIQLEQNQGLFTNNEKIESTPLIDSVLGDTLTL